MKLHQVEVLDREKFGNHTLLRYRWAGDTPRPGQFIMVRTTLSASASTLDPFLSRPLFVHDYADGEVSLLFEVRGRGTALLAEESSHVTVSAPLGRGFGLNVDGPVALVSGGVWVSPFKLLSRNLSLLDIPHDLYLEIPASAPEAYAVWISKAYPTATFVRTDEGQEAPHDLLKSMGDLSRYRALYASGTSETLATLREASLDVVPAQLAVRERMACAVGSCYGCAVPVWRSGERTYARACVDGPVFEAEVLAW